MVETKPGRGTQSGGSGGQCGREQPTSSSRRRGRSGRRERGWEFVDLNEEKKWRRVKRRRKRRRTRSDLMGLPRRLIRCKGVVGNSPQI
jgi:hypothetical protein